MPLKRALLVLAAFTLAAPAAAVELLSPREAYEQVEAGQVVLLDIRTEGEWAETGIGANALPLDMTSPQFIPRLKEVIASNPGKKLAFMCRSGNRSGQLTRQLEQAGLQNVVDVDGGIIRWVQDGIPVAAHR